MLIKFYENIGIPINKPMDQQVYRVLIGVRLINKIGVDGTLAQK